MDASRLFELFFVARITPAGEDAAQHGGQPQRSALHCRWAPPGGGGVPVPAADNLSPFCWPLGVEAVCASAYLVTAEFSFTLTGGNGSRLHGVCRRTHDPTYRPAPRPGSTHKGAASSVVEQKRLPQVICILSQHCWQPFFSKVLEIADQLLAPHASAAELPSDSPAGLFLASLPRLLLAAGPPLPPLGALLRVPLPYSAAPISVDRMRRALMPPGRPAADTLLGLSADAIELEVPPNLGNSTANAGISLARLLWFLTPRQAVTLVASLLLERRIILVARDAETVSAAVHAANALLYPFRWQHIYLPLLPLALKDYLAAPMPYLVGIQAECLPLLRGMALEETVMIDLDRLGSCTPELGSPGDDYFLLPFARELEDVFEVVREHIQSPTEFDSTPKCTELVQDFFMRLVGGYRKFVRPDEEVTPAALALGLDRPMTSGSVGCAANAVNRSGSAKGIVEEENPSANGFLFDQTAFINSYRRKDKITAFLQQFRNSQMLEVFITERLKLASEGYVTDDPFEQKVAERNTRLGLRLGIPGVGMVAVPGMGGAGSTGRFGSLLRKAGNAVKQSSVGLAASFKQLGSSQQEVDLQIAGRAHSGPNLAHASPGMHGLGLSRVSPGAHGLGLARRSPAPAATSLVAHSRGKSFSGTKPTSRSASYNNLARASANLAVFNGGVQPSLEQLRPDMFFGADTDDDDDASSVNSRASQELAGQAQVPMRSSASSPGPLAAALGAGRSFGTLFHPSSSPPQPHPSPSASPPLGSRGSSLQHTASRFGTSEWNEQQVHQQQLDAAASGGWASGGWGGASSSTFAAGTAAIASGAAIGALASGLTPFKQSAGYGGSDGPAEPASTRAAAGAVAPSPGMLHDLATPIQHRTQQQQQQARPLQLFPEAGSLPPGPQSGSASVHSRSSSTGGWANFDETQEFAGAFGSPQGSGNIAPAVAAAAASNSFFPDIGMSPLGSAMSRSVLRQHSSSGTGPVAVPASQQQQHERQGCQQAQPQDLQATQWQEQQAPALPQAPPSWAYSQYDSRQPTPQQQQPQQQRQQHSSPPQQQQPRPPVPDGVTAGWAPYGQSSSPAGRAEPALPSVCRQTAHSPLAAGMSSVHRIASLSRLEVHRSTSSSGDGTGSVASTPSMGRQQQQRQHHQPPDTFASLAAAAVAEASEHTPSRQHTSSSGCDASTGASFHAPLRASSTSSWAEYAEAPPPAASAYTGNPFQDPLPCQLPCAEQHQQQHQQQHQVLYRQVTASARTSSFGDWASVPPAASGAGVLASQLSNLHLI